MVTKEPKASLVEAAELVDSLQALTVTVVLPLVGLFSPNSATDAATASLVDVNEHAREAIVRQLEDDAQQARALAEQSADLEALLRNTPHLIVRRDPSGLSGGLPMSDPSVYVDPEKLERFASELAASAKWFDDAMSNTQGRLSHLGRTWRDDEFVAFCQQFERARRTVKHFTDVSARVRADILADADRARAYQSIKS